MPAVYVPVEPSIPHQRMTVSLGGVDFRLDFRWNATSAAWYMDVRDVDGTLVLAGQKIVIGTLIGNRQIGVPNYPRGVFIAADSSRARADAGLDDFGTRVRLAFYSYSDLTWFLAKIDGFVG